jgi:2-oxoisovalerate dehydrogenase E1 component
METTDRLKSEHEGRYSRVLLIRCVEQKLLSLFSEGKLFGTVHTCIGQEFTGIAVAEALQPGDFIFSNHRCHGHYIARTDDVEGLIAEIMGKATGICGGLGGSQHICASRVFSNGVQGGITPVSTGMALAEKLRRTNNIGVVFIGDGTLGEGVLYESLNIASLWSVPLLFVCENNYYAQSTHQSQNLAGDICRRAEAFGINTAHSNTWDPEELVKSIAGSVQKVRSEKKPFFHRIDTYRLMAHSKGDDSRDHKVVQEYWKKDPIQRFISDHKVESEKMLANIKKRIDSAVDRAEKSPYPSEKSVVNKANSPSKTEWEPTELESHIRIAEVIYKALKRNMQKDERILLIGEDIEAPYGGAFKVTKDLSELFPLRVRNTPISEAAIIGIGNGLALNGMVPICEIMFGGFLALGMDQLLNHASKFRHMYNKQVTLPLVVRTPMGGRRGYGPTHSQSIEKHFLGLPDLRVFAIHERYSPGQFYDRLLDGIISPALVVENKLLYGRRIGEKVPSGYVLERTTETFATTRLRPLANPDVTIVCYGGMLSVVEETLDELFYEHEIICEVIVPMLLYPLNPWPIIESIQKTGKVLVVEEGVGFSDFGSEVIAQVVELSGSTIQQAGRLCCPAIPVPSCAVLEKQVLPGKENIIKKVVELANG